MDKSEIITQQIKDEYRALHFERALDLLNDIEQPDKEQLLLLIRTKRALYEFEQAYDLSLAFDTPDFLLERAKTLFARGKTASAKQLFESLEQTVPVRLACASLLSETGHVEYALQELNKIDRHTLHGFDEMDFLLLKADLFSFQEKTASAFRFYGEALGAIKDCIPENWRPLRAMLIHHNMADTYEQLEQEDKAIELYATALDEMREQRKTDDTITDLASYEIELLLSAANCFSNNEQFDKAYAYLSQAESCFDCLLPLSRPYFSARIHYISGLIEMNAGNDEMAIRCFSSALQEQERLVEAGRDKSEHLARTAYYLGTLLEDDHKNEKLRLFEQARPVFEQVIEKEPSFYMAALADMANEQGRLAGTKQQALEAYDEAAGWYEKMLERDPKDALAAESLLITQINRMKYDPHGPETEVRAKLENMKYEKENIPFLYSACSALAAQDHSPKFSAWLARFLAFLPSEFDA